MLVETRNFKNVAKEAKRRLKQGFWEEYKNNLASKLQWAKTEGINEGKVERYYAEKVSSTIKGERNDDEFYLKVKNMLLNEGEVSNALGRLTDKELFTTLNYEEKQRYTLKLSEMYLKAVERFKSENEVERIQIKRV